MMKYNWDEILKSKSDIELLKIYNGDYILNTNARISAAKKLLERNFDKEKIKEIKEKSIAKLDFEINKVIRTNIEKEKKKNIIWSILNFLLLCVIFYFIDKPDFNSKTILETKQVLFFSYIIFIILITVLNIKLFKKKRLRELRKDLKIKKEIKKKIIQEIQI